MRRKIFSIYLCVLVFLALLVTLDFGFENTVMVKGATITVDDSGGADYTHIQDAVNNSKNGDTIFVYAGGYVGPVEIEKENLTLIGEDMESVTIYGGPNPDLNPGEPTYPGLVIEYSSNIVIKDIGINSEYFPLIIDHSNNITVENTLIGGSMTVPSKVDCIYSSDIHIKNSRFWEEGWSTDFWAHFDSDNILIESCLFEYWKYGSPLLKEYRKARFWINDDSHILAVNCDVDDTYPSDTSTLSLGYFLTVNVFDALGNALEGASVIIRDAYGTVVNTSKTDANGVVDNIILIKSIQNSSKTTNYSPHNVTVYKHSLKGFADPPPYMNKNKNITIVLYEQYDSIFLSSGSNLISFNRIQSDTSLGSVLQSINGDYNSVRWYDAQDRSDHWKQNHLAKSPHLNDLNQLNHTMGFWIDINEPGGTRFIFNGTEPIEPGGTRFIFNGTEPISNQFIQLYKGWNLVGYPSLTNHNRTVGLNQLDFGVNVDCIQWFDSLTKTWHFMDENDSFEIGRGYWIHATQDCVWEVPL
jgi:hypothetical protein